MEFLKLPNELILAFGDWADAPTLSALACTSRRLHTVLNPLLYRRNAKERNSDALVWAAENGRVYTAKLCLSHGADINTALSLEEETRAGDFRPSGTPLHYAVRRGHDDLVKYLLANGADHQRWCTHLCKCRAPLVNATRSNNQVAVQTAHWSPLHLALCRGHTSTAKILIERGASCEMTLQLSWSSGRGANELRPSPVNVVHEIAIHKNAEVLDYMISSGYRLATMINSVAFDGNTPLHYLAIKWSQDSLETFHKLLSLDPDLNLPNNDLLRPIECFINVGHLDAARHLFELGARPYHLQRSILSAVQVRLSNLRLSKSQDSSGWNYRWIEIRNDFVLSLINHALDVGHLTRDVGENPRIGQNWLHIFLIACTQPDLLQRLLIEGFKPESLTGGRSLLVGLLELLTLPGNRLDDGEVRSLHQAIRLLTRAGERWDRRGIREKTPLEYLVRDSGSAAPEVRARLFSSLLGNRPPDETGAEQAHLDQLCQYALDHGDTQTCKNLVRWGAKDPLFHGRLECGLIAEVSANYGGTSGP